MAKTEAEIRERKEKKEKKEKKRKHDAGDDETPVKKDKKKRKSTDAVAVPVNEDSIMDVDGDLSVKTAVATTAGGDAVGDKKASVSVPLAALVPFANPLCDEKSQKKVLKSVKKAAKAKALKRGVKECVKSIRKSPTAGPQTPADALPSGIVVLAADISPMDVISHIPVLCEDHSIPYVYVPSRAELGAAGATKRPTSVVMLTPHVGKKAEGGDDAAAEWKEAYADLHKLALKLGQTVKV